MIVDTPIPGIKYQIQENFVWSLLACEICTRILSTKLSIECRLLTVYPVGIFQFFFFSFFLLVDRFSYIFHMIFR